MLNRLLRDRISVIWLVLIVATLSAWALGAGHGMPHHEYAAFAIFVIAFAKVHFVGWYFMELRESPLALILAFEAWVGVVFCVLVGLYL